ncbi:MAG: septum formation initiator family protein [bacterium]|nr:septum formation initiator family protein [bacterium]
MARKKSKKSIRRMVVFGALCLAVNSTIIYSLFNTWTEIYEKRQEKKDLSENLVTLKEEEESLKVELNKLKDPSYVAKYAREKLFYSESDEYIIKIK